MLTVELVYDCDCPNVLSTRENLMRAFALAGIPPKWTEWECASPETPPHARQFGSPAILVNGKDMASASANSAAACRIYESAAGTRSGVPSVELIAGALKGGNSESSGTGATKLKRHLPLLPAILFALLPKVACPACWPAYAGLLSAVGLGFVARTEYLLPLTSIFLAIVLVGLGYRARSQRGFGPFWLGTAAAGIVLFGKFWVESNPLFYTGLMLLVGSSIWNMWPRRESKAASCCEGTPGGTQVTSRVQEN